jgi:hypothetical protein
VEPAGFRRSDAEDLQQHPACRAQAQLDRLQRRRVLEEDSQKVTDDLIDLVRQCADGTYRTKNEQNGYAEISLFKDGVIL